MNKLKIPPRLLLLVALAAVSIALGTLLIGGEQSASTAEHMVQAGNAAPVETPKSFFAESMAAGSLLRTLLALLVVIACIYLGVWLLKRVSGGRVSMNGQRAVIDVLQTRHFGPKRAISLIRVADRAVLVGMTDQQMTTLTELTAEETSQLETGGGAQDGQRPAFPHWMQRAKDQFERTTSRVSSVTAA